MAKENMTLTVNTMAKAITIATLRDTRTWTPAAHKMQIATTMLTKANQTATTPIVIVATIWTALIAAVLTSTSESHRHQVKGRAKPVRQLGQARSSTLMAVAGTLSTSFRAATRATRAVEWAALQKSSRHLTLSSRAAGISRMGQPGTTTS